MYKRYFKRLLDFTLSLTAIIILSPIFIIIAIIVKIKLGNPILFIQKRPGKDEKIFNIHKFRTMTNNRDVKGKLLPDKKRLTKFGRILRSNSLDELPELFNIFKGDMSIVGPRPQLIKDLVFFDKKQLKRQTVLPGLTGLAQINGRNSISWEEKIDYDLEYIENITFPDDCKIMYKTLLNLFLDKDINTEGIDTAEDYGDYLLRENIISEKEYYTCINRYIEIIKSSK